MGTRTRGFANLIGANGPISLPSGVGGKVLQVVTGTFATQSESSSASYVATGLTASITPSSASNKILILYSLPLRNSTANINVVHSIFKNSSNILGSFGAGIHKTDSTAIMAVATANYLDSPNTTSSTTYEIYVKPESVTAQWCGGGATSSITLLEIAA